MLCIIFGLKDDGLITDSLKSVEKKYKLKIKTIEKHIFPCVSRSYLFYAVCGCDHR